jgi:hypothetical protein
MRKTFAGWYSRSADEVAAIWDEAVFVPDANVLLHCLRHPENIREELLRIFGVLKNSLWIPYQVGLEFHRNRLGVELGAEDAYQRLTKEYESTLNQVRDRLRQLRAHPIISVEKELAAVDMFMSDFRSRMEAAQAQHPREAIADAVTRLTNLLDGRIGAKWSTEQLAQLRKEGEDRYAKRIPPGYRDAKKDAGDFDKFGDLIIWKDMISKAKTDKRPVIFVSDDAKEDWWWLHQGRKLGPRPELIEEFCSNTDQDFHIYEFPHFLRIAAERYPEIKASADEVEKSLLDDEKARKRQADAEHVRALESKIALIEDERHRIVSTLSGSPALDSVGVPPDRSSLRIRLDQLNGELALLSDELAALRAPSSEDQSA